MSCNILGTTHAVITKLPSERLVINHIFAMAFNITLTIPTILLNGAAAITILKSYQLKSKPCYFMILVQSLNDFAVGVLGIPFFVFYLASGIGGLTNCIVATLAIWSTIIPLGISTFTLCVMSIERYIAIKHPYAYRIQVTQKRLTILVGCSAAVVLVIVILSFLYEKLFMIYALVKLTFVFFFVSFVYAKIYVIVRKLSRSENVQCELSPEGNVTRRKLFLQEVKRAKSCFIVVFCFSLLWFLPTTMIILFTKNLNQFERLASQVWCFTFGLCNSSFNSLIFFWTNALLRKETFKMFRGFCVYFKR